MFPYWGSNPYHCTYSGDSLPNLEHADIYPSPQYFSYEDAHLFPPHLFSQHTTPSVPSTQEGTICEPQLSITKNMKAETKKKRQGRKDRHSKICTATGPRDRRMRLSLQIARKFFDLQDMLGFDKASKTIEWLFLNSKSAIKDVMNKTSHPRLSQSPIGLWTDHQPRGELRELRDKARARARARTKEKLKMREGESSSVVGFVNPKDNLCGSDYGFESLDEMNCLRFQGSDSMGSSSSGYCDGNGNSDTARLLAQLLLENGQCQGH